MSGGNGKLFFADEFGQRLRSARKRAALTLGEVASVLGVSEAAVSRWESESNYPSRRNAEAFGRLVGADPTWLLTGIHPPSNTGDAALTPKRFYLICERRVDGGLRIECPEVTGLVVSSKDPHAAMRDVIPAINTIMRHNAEKAESERKD